MNELAPEKHANNDACTRYTSREPEQAEEVYCSECCVKRIIKRCAVWKIIERIFNTGWLTSARLLCATSASAVRRTGLAQATVLRCYTSSRTTARAQWRRSWLCQRRLPEALALGASPFKFKRRQLCQTCLQRCSFLNTFSSWLTCLILCVDTWIAYEYIMSFRDGQLATIRLRLHAF